MTFRLLVLALGIVALSGCDMLRSDESRFCMVSLEPYADPYWGEMVALRNGEPWPVSPWHGSLYAISDPEREEMTILMDVFNEAGFHRERLSFAGIPKQVGTYELPKQIVQREQEQFRFFFTSEDDGDVGADTYLLYKPATERFLTIESYDASTCTIEGTFTLTVVRDTTDAKVFPYPDTLHFTEGRFRTRLVTYP